MEEKLLSKDSKSSNNKGKSYKLGYMLLAAMTFAIGYFAIFKISNGSVEMDFMTAFFLMLSCIVIGDVVSIKTKAFVPAIFITSALFVLGFWTIFPKNILEVAGSSKQLSMILVMLMIVHLGTMLNVRELAAQWRTVTVALGGIFAIIVAMLTIGRFVAGYETALIATPPLTGGLVAALMMQGYANSVGNEYLAILAMSVYVLQGFVGFPLTNICLKAENRRLLKKVRNGEPLADIEKIHETKAGTDKKLFPQLPEKYNFDGMYIFKMMALVLISNYLGVLSKSIGITFLSGFVWALIVGILACEFGFVKTQPLIKSKSMGFVLIMIMMFLFAGLSGVTPEILQKLFVDFLTLIAISVAAIMVVSVPLGRALGFSTPMAIAIGLSSVAGGFPPSYVLTVEAARATAETDEEYELLLNNALPKTLVAGFVTATSGSVIIAGIFLGLIGSL